MKKNIFLLTIGLLMGVVLGSVLPTVQISIVAEAREDQLVLASEPILEEEVIDEVASETMSGEYFEAVASSETSDTTLLMESVELNLEEESVVREYNAYRVHNGRVPVLPRENLTERARTHNARIISGEETPYSGTLSRTQFLYSGVVSGSDADLPASTIINFWAHLEIGRYYILKEDITKIGLSVEKVGGEMYYTLILDWSEGVR